MGVLAAAPIYVVAADVVGVAGGYLGWHLVPWLGDNFVLQPIADVAFPLVGFLLGSALGLGVLVLLTAAITRSVGRQTNAR